MAEFGPFNTRQEALDEALRIALAESGPEKSFTIKICTCDGRRLQGMSVEELDAYVVTCPECKIIEIGDLGTKQ